MCHIVLFLPILGLAVFLVLPLVWAGPVYAVIFLLSVAMYMLIIKAMRQPITTGTEALLRSRATVVGGDKGYWRVQVGNETCDAESPEILEVGDSVRITSINGLRLRVEH